MSHLYARHFVDNGVKSLDVRYFTGTFKCDGGDESTTILNDLVILGNSGNFSDNPEKEKIGAIDYLLSKGADVNVADVSITIASN